MRDLLHASALVLPLLSTALLAGPGLARPAQDGELDALVAAEAAGAEEGSMEAIWERAVALRQAEGLSGASALDASLDRMLKREDLGQRGTLLIVAARMQGDQPDAGSLHTSLLPLLDAEESVALGAAGLLGNDVFRTLRRDDRDSLGKRLVEGARDASRSPSYRMAFAKAAGRVGRGTEMRQARDEMRAFLDSGDPALRALGALTLAATGVEISGDLQDELERLASLPNADGILAASYLKQERIRELHERKYKELEKEVADADLPRHLREFDAVLRMVENYHLEGDLVEREQLVEAALDGMLRAMDEHSSYLSGAAYADFLVDLEAEYGGIGAYVGEDPNSGLFTITEPIYSGPAYRGGLLTDDKIVRIDDWPTLGEPVDDIIRRLKGKPNTPVKLYIWRRGMDPDLIDRPTEDMVVVLNREVIRIPAVSHQMLPGGIGLVELSTFSRDCHKQLAVIFQELLDQGMRALILDLRNNSGGLLPEARDVSDLFLPRDTPVVITEEVLRDPETHVTRYPAILPEDMPVVVLVNRFSASASEIVAGALKDHERATLVGDLTFGKGSVQRFVEVMGVPSDRFIDENSNGRWDTWERIVEDYDGDGEVDYAPQVKMTIARYLLPSGRSIHREIAEDGSLLSEGGIEPHIEVRQPLIETWRVLERRRLYREEGVVQDYVAENWDEHFDLFRKLAVTDAKDPGAYPGFEEWAGSLETTLPRGDLRMLLRTEIRRRMQDDRGAKFPEDFQEDYQVQRAVAECLARLDDDAGRYDAYAQTFLDEDAVAEDRIIALDVANRERMRDAETLLLELQSLGGVVTPDKLDEVLELLREN